jgi:hypothetical protein
VYRAEIVGSTVTLEKNGVTLGEVTDPNPITSGSPGIAFCSSEGAGNTQDARLGWASITAGTL